MTDGNKKVWVSDLIGDDYKKWNNEYVALDCGTGCGKTYFILNKLGLYAEKQGKSILYLCNRNKLKRQMFHDMRASKIKSIWIESYQNLQNTIKNGGTIPHYDYIVADECHYFTTDALFNNYTDISYNYLMNRKDSTVIFLSATAKTFFKLLLDKEKLKKENLYNVEKDYSYVKDLYYYQADELSTIINNILENEPESKLVVFCNSADRMFEMYSTYGDKANYLCSNSKTTPMKLKEICGYNPETKKVNDCIKHYPDGRISFDKRILFTTKVLDNGVDLKDKQLKHIITELFDVDCMIQSLGRKRNDSTDPEDTCTFYIREYQKKGIQGILNRNNYQFEPVQLYKTDYQQFYEQYGHDKKRDRIKTNKIFYPLFTENNIIGNLKVNECRYNKYEQDNNILNAMVELGYIPIINSLLGHQLSEKSKYIEVDVEQIDLFLEYLKSIEGKYLYSVDRKIIKSEFETIGVQLRYTGINTFNGALDDIYKDLYQPRFYNQSVDGKPLKDKRRKLEDGSTNPNRDKTYWILELRC